MTWRHAVLEIYEPDSGWPDTGNVADWIDSDSVGYCQGRVEDLVILTPLAKILRWKLCAFVKDLWWSLTWRFRKSNLSDLFDDEEICEYGCHFVEPYGFVPMAGCPVHD